VLNTGAGADVVRVRGTAGANGASLFVTGATGDDTIQIGSAANTLDAITGPVTVQGNGHVAGDSLTVNDGGNTTVNRTFTLSPGAVSWQGGPTISYGTTETVVLNAGQRGDSFIVKGTAAQAALTVNAGAGVGADTFRMQPGTYAGALTLNGQSGLDTLDYSAYATGVTVALAQNKATNTTSISGIETVLGGAGNDLLRGDDGINQLHGNGGHDILVGYAGADGLFGGGGRDLLIGGAGADTLNGGTDDDVYVGGSTAFDANEPALLAVRAEWARTDLTGTP
jgi:Ca2+-binding RTX toxin-like protein